MTVTHGTVILVLLSVMCGAAISCHRKEPSQASEYRTQDELVLELKRQGSTLEYEWQWLKSLWHKSGTTQGRRAWLLGPAYCGSNRIWLLRLTESQDGYVEGVLCIMRPRRFQPLDGMRVFICGGPGQKMQASITRQRQEPIPKAVIQEQAVVYGEPCHSEALFLEFQLQIPREVTHPTVVMLTCGKETSSIELQWSHHAPVEAMGLD